MSGLLTRETIERMLIGWCIRNSSLIERVQSHLPTEEHYTTPQTRIMARHLYKLADAGSVITYFTLWNSLSEEGEVEKSGGILAIHNLDRDAPQEINLRQVILQLYERMAA